MGFLVTKNLPKISPLQMGTFAMLFPPKLCAEISEIPERHGVGAQCSHGGLHHPSLRRRPGPAGDHLWKTPGGNHVKNDEK